MDLKQKYLWQRIYMTSSYLLAGFFNISFTAVYIIGYNFDGDHRLVMAHLSTPCTKAARFIHRSSQQKKEKELLDMKSLKDPVIWKNFNNHKQSQTIWNNPDWQPILKDLKQPQTSSSNPDYKQISKIAS